MTSKPSLGFTIGGWLGNEAERLIVGTVHADGIAAKAGILSGDIITSIGDQAPALWVQTGQRVGKVAVSLRRAAGDGTMAMDVELVFPKPKPPPKPHELLLQPYVKALTQAIGRLTRALGSLRTHGSDPDTVKNVSDALVWFIKVGKEVDSPETLTPEKFVGPVYALDKSIGLFESAVSLLVRGDSVAHDCADLVHKTGYHVICAIREVAYLIAPPPPRQQQQPRTSFTGNRSHPKPGDLTIAYGRTKQDETIPMMGAMNVVSMDYGAPQPPRLHDGPATRAIGMAPEKRGPGLYRGKPRPMGGPMMWQDSTGAFIDEWNS